ncbi:uncharacterized protein LOC133795990 [Humulus lupulus]|uniref:uncharacterized protein LOC133795990 n=1 Tax=Humulus lupulus TaxID=3486 RepID=UPI002B4059AD|nr:uncharacterized protein LOC133795990 [Humulus lupulus]
MARTKTTGAPKPLAAASGSTSSASPLAASGSSLNSSVKIRAQKKTFPVSKTSSLVLPSMSPTLISLPAPPTKEVVPTETLPSAIESLAPNPKSSKLETAKSKGSPTATQPISGILPSSWTRSKETASSSSADAKKGGKRGKPSPPKKSPPVKKLKITPHACSSFKADPSEDPSGEAANPSKHSSSENTKRSESTQELYDLVASEERVVELDDGFDASDTQSEPSEPLPSDSKGKKPVIFYYANRKVICEKNFNLATHRVFGVIGILQEREWLDSLQGYSEYVDRVVKEFYANITDDFLNHNSFMYGKVYVRGHWFSFTVKDIATALNFPIGVILDTLEFNKDLVLSELVGQKVSWNPSTSLSILDLTYTYAMLMQFSLSNWMPSSNTVVVSQELAFFLFKIGSGAQKSKSLVIPSVSTTTVVVPSGVGPDISEMLAVKTDLTMVQNRLGTLEATQQAILSQLTALAKGV